MTVDRRRSISPAVMVACAATIVTLSLGARQAFGLFLLPMSTDITVDRGAFGLAIALQNLLWGLAQPTVGGLADRFGAGRTLAVGALLYAGGLVGTAAAGDALGVSVSLGVLVGLALSATTFVVVLGAVGRAVAAEQRGRAFGLITAGGSVGMFLMVPGVQGAIALIGWRATLIALGVVMLAILALATRVTGRAQADHDAPSESAMHALGRAGRHSGFWLLNAGFLVCGFHVAFIATHLPAYLGDAGLAPRIGAIALALIGLFNVFGAYWFGRCGDRYRNKHVLSLLYLARGGIIAAFLLLPLNPVVAIVFACAIGFVWLGTVPLTSGLVGEIFGYQRLSLLFGVVFMSHQAGSFLGAWAAGAWYTATGSYDAVWLLSITLALAAAALHAPIRDTPVAPATPARTRP